MKTSEMLSALELQHLRQALRSAADLAEALARDAGREQEVAGLIESYRIAAGDQ